MALEFSVVIPVRNGGAYIEAAVRSVLDQTYPVHSLFLLENQSQDNTLAIISAFNDPRIHVIPSGADLPIEANWNRIKDLPLAQYMTFMGHDDILYPRFLEEIVTLIEQHPQATLFQSHQRYIDAQGKPIRECQPVPLSESADEFIERVFLEKEEVLGAGYVMRSADYIAVGGIPQLPNLLYADVVLWYKLSALGYKVCSPQFLTGFRLHEQNTHRLSDLNMYYRACLHYLEFLQQTTYFRTRKEKAQAYVSEYLHRERRSTFARLLQTNDSRLIVQAIAQDTHLIRQMQQDGRLYTGDGKAQLYKYIISVGHPVLRQRIYHLFKTLLSLRK